MNFIVTIYFYFDKICSLYYIILMNLMRNILYVLYLIIINILCVIELNMYIPVVLYNYLFMLIWLSIYYYVVQIYIFLTLLILFA